MPLQKFIISATLLYLTILCFSSCKEGKSKTLDEKFSYEKFKSDLDSTNTDPGGDSPTIFDADAFTPGKDSLNTLLIKMDTQWHRDAAMMEKIDTFIGSLKTKDSLSIQAKETLKENIRILDSFLSIKNTATAGNCKEKQCMIYIAVNKSKQKLYLYINQVLKDSFLVSTGIKSRKTPDINTRPSGPIFTKYTSRKFPGGNYNGLGNMPYAVFIKGGYAIHGTTKGNFSKLGSVASHGCIRVHPDNAIIIYTLAKQFGLNNMWVTVRDSL
jgi:hypothetical protein